jgi:DNA-binding response OmpR family regulator
VTKVLFVEDDAVIREVVQLSLARDGFSVSTAEDGLAGWDAFTQIQPEVVLLDIMLPGQNGVSLCRRIREVSMVPILLLSARSDAVDVVLGLEAGADDYLTKPFDSTVLSARIKTVLRRTAIQRPMIPVHSSVFISGDLEVDKKSLEIRRAGERVNVTPTELRLLMEFVQAPGTVLARQKLLEQVWDCAWGGDTRVVDVHVQRLRVKIGQDKIETVRGFGYKLRT